MPKAQYVYRRFLDGPDGADVKELAIHRRVSRLNYSRRCAEASAVQAHIKQGLPLAPGMKIGFVIREAHTWEVDPERTASEFDAGYYGGLLEKAWTELHLCFHLVLPTISRSDKFIHRSSRQGSGRRSRLYCLQY